MGVGPGWHPRLGCCSCVWKSEEGFAAPQSVSISGRTRPVALGTYGSKVVVKGKTRGTWSRREGLLNAAKHMFPRSAEPVALANDHINELHGSTASTYARIGCWHARRRAQHYYETCWLRAASPVSSPSTLLRSVADRFQPTAQPRFCINLAGPRSGQSGRRHLN